MLKKHFFRITKFQNQGFGSTLSRPAAGLFQRPAHNKKFNNLNRIKVMPVKSLSACLRFLLLLFTGFQWPTMHTFASSEKANALLPGPRMLQLVCRDGYQNF